MYEFVIYNSIIKICPFYINFCAQVFTFHLLSSINAKGKEFKLQATVSYYDIILSVWHFQAKKKKEEK